MVAQKGSRWWIAWGILLLLPVTGSSEEVLRLANPTTFLTGLITLAKHRQLFAHHDLSVTLLGMPTGDEALQAVEENRADLASTAETAFTLLGLANPSWRAVAQIGDWDNEVRILARRDAGINMPKDLRGKRIATQNRLSSFFFLEQYLMKQGFTLRDIIPVFLPSKELAAALVNKEVDAISSRDPFLSHAKKQLADQALELAAPGLYRKTFLLAGQAHTMENKKSAIIHLLQALIQTEQFVREQPETARKLLQQHHADEADLQRIWSEIRLGVWLDHHLVLTMEQVAEWAMRNRMVPAGKIPNFSANIDRQPLQSVRPIAINLVQ